jgi:hypothetical protein
MNGANGNGVIGNVVTSDVVSDDEASNTQDNGVNDANGAVQPLFVFPFGRAEETSTGSWTAILSLERHILRLRDSS